MSMGSIRNPLKAFSAMQNKNIWWNNKQREYSTEIDENENSQFVFMFGLFSVSHWFFLSIIYWFVPEPFEPVRWVCEWKHEHLQHVEHTNRCSNGAVHFRLGLNRLQLQGLMNNYTFEYQLENESQTIVQNNWEHLTTPMI